MSKQMIAQREGRYNRSRYGQYSRYGSYSRYGPYSRYGIHSRYVDRTKFTQSESEGDATMKNFPKSFIPMEELRADSGSEV